ncbi:hypothetical protein SUDANB108_00259 [Streptomyces sp. enrichment culture]
MNGQLPHPMHPTPGQPPPRTRRRATHGTSCGHLAEWDARGGGWSQP